MKIIFSRKGFDKAAGGVPSPIFEDSSMFSLPIPDYRRGQTYGDIYHRDLRISDVVHDLTKGRIRDITPAHLDPDICSTAMRSRLDGWRGAFGQTGAAQSHLVKQGVDVGDVFLFFGWFDHVRKHDQGWERLVHRGNGFHAIFGWLQVGEILNVAADGKRIRDDMRWLHQHPHVRRQSSELDVIYLAADRLTLPGIDDQSVSGSGTVERYSEHLRLSKPGQNNKSLWHVPDWMHPSTGRILSYHTDPERWTDTAHGMELKTVGRGQEFVMDVHHCHDTMNWLKNVVHS